MITPDLHFLLKDLDLDFLNWLASCGRIRIGNSKCSQDIIIISSAVSTVFNNNVNHLTVSWND